MIQEEKVVGVSVIIPIYNVRDYLEKCLDSVAHQVFQDYEVIMVDDGSTDGSIDIERKYAAQYPQFRLIEKENGGVASARNMGVSAARGEYISFVDGDDFVEPEFLQELYRAATEKDADVVCCNFNRYFPKRRMAVPHLLTKFPKTYPTPPILKSLLHDAVVQSYMWNKLWRRTLFVDHNITFPSIEFAEDTNTSLQLFFFAKQVVILSDVLYNYTQRGNSVVHSLNPKRENDFLCAFASTRIFLEEHNAYEDYRRHFQFFTLKSLLFSWGVIVIIHWKEKSLKGILGNFKRCSRYLNYYGGRKFSLNEPRPDHTSVVRQPTYG